MNFKVVMRFESKLCHISENRVVVQVNGWLNDENVGTALAEGSTVELAEDKAISRLSKRITNGKNSFNDHSIKSKNNIQLTNESKVELVKSEVTDTKNRNQEPSDWSNELTAIDSEIERLKWSRDDEKKFLEKNLGYNNRNKITKYTELIHYLSILKKVDNLKFLKNNITNMIEESDIILRELSWDNNQGREYLQKEFNVSTRKELDENQLISFVEKLKSIRNQYLSH